VELKFGRNELLLVRHSAGTHRETPTDPRASPGGRRFFVSQFQRVRSKPNVRPSLTVRQASGSPERLLMLLPYGNRSNQAAPMTIHTLVRSREPPAKQQLGATAVASAISSGFGQR
jgi:hypothetical protein